MVKTWNEPRIEVQKFVADEYVAACYTLVCAIPGENAEKINDGTSPVWFGFGHSGQSQYPSTGSITWDGTLIEADNLLHGNCGNNSTSYDVDHSVGYEHNNDGTVKNAIIENVSIGHQYDGNIYYANWTSNNGYQKDYQHYGFAIMNESKPNHS